MTDLQCVEYAVQVVLRRCRQMNPQAMPPSGETVMGWLATALYEAKKVRDGEMWQADGTVADDR